MSSSLFIMVSFSPLIISDIQRREEESLSPSFFSGRGWYQSPCSFTLTERRRALFLVVYSYFVSFGVRLARWAIRKTKQCFIFWLFIHTLHPSVWHVKQLGKQSSFFSAFSLALCGASPFCGASCGIPAFGWWIVASGSPLPSSFFAIVPPSLSRLLSHARSLFQISLCAPSRSAYLAPSRHT